MPTDGLVRGPDVYQQMADMIFGYWVSQTIRAFADLSLADHFADGPHTAAEAAACEGSGPCIHESTALGRCSEDKICGFYSLFLCQASIIFMLVPPPASAYIGSVAVDSQTAEGVVPQQPLNNKPSVLTASSEGSHAMPKRAFQARHRRSPEQMGARHGC